jgi:hypothetical protein
MGRSTDHLSSEPYASWRVDRYLLGQLQVGPVILSVRVEPHKVGHRSVQEVQEGGRQDGHVDVLPLEREH